MGWTDAEIERCSKIKLGKTGGSFVRHPAEKETEKTRQTLSRFSKQRRDRITLLLFFSQVTLPSLFAPKHAISQPDGLKW